MEQRDTFAKYAIFQVGSHQYQAIEGKTIAVQRLKAEPGQTVTFDEVLLRKTDDTTIEVGQPFVGTPVKAEIVKHLRGPKLVVFRFKRRKKVRVKNGHRQELTVIRVSTI